MAIKYNRKDVKRVTFNDNDVKKIIKETTVVWVKPYTLTESSEDSSLVRYKIVTTDEPSVNVDYVTKKPSKNVYTGTVYNNDKLKVEYVASSTATVDSVKVNNIKIADRDITMMSAPFSVSLILS